MLGICICQKHVKEKKGVTDSEICSYRWNKEKCIQKESVFE
jgi:endonuclease I